MNRVLTRLCACATAFCVSFAVTAQEGALEGAGAAESGKPVDNKIVAKSTAKHFHALVKLAFANDNVMVKLPRQAEFKSAVEGKFYPNGSTFRVTKAGASPVVFEFGPESFVKVDGVAEFSTREIVIGEKARVLQMGNGTVSVSLPRTMPTGLFSVSYPNFTAKDLAGDSSHQLDCSGDGNEALVHVITGMLAVDGMHFKVARMGAADRLRIRTTADALFTSMRGEAGDYKVSLDKGVVVYRDPISGKETEQVRKLDYSLTPQCAIKIFRKRSEVGGRMAVSVMTFDAAGEMRNRYTFAENSAKVNFGEEVVRVQDISFKTKSDDKKNGGKKADNEAVEGESADKGSQESASGSAESATSESTGGSGNDSDFGAF